MASNIFDTKTDKPTVVRAGKATISIDGTNIIALQVSVQFQRTVELVQTIGTKRVMAIGEPQGTLTCGTLITDKIPSVLTKSGCTPFSCTISFSESCDMKGNTITAHNCVVSSVTFQAQGGRGYISNDFTCTFTGLTA